MPEHRVRTLLGVVRVRLERDGLDLGERGGFEARWADDGDKDGDKDGDEHGDGSGVLGLEAYRGVVKDQLAEQYRRRHGRDPGGVALNLASHQLLDDLTGWTKLNLRPR